MKAVALAHRLDEEIGELTTQVAHPWDLIRSPDGTRGSVPEYQAADDELVAATHERMSRLIIANDDCFSNSAEEKKRLGYLE